MKRELGLDGWAPWLTATTRGQRAEVMAEEHTQQQPLGSAVLGVAWQFEHGLGLVAEEESSSDGVLVRP
jgi:hypothetical protein